VRVFLFFTKLVPLVLLAVMVVLPIYDWIAPAPFASEVTRGKFRLCVAVGGQYHYLGNNLSAERFEQRTYAFVPDVFRDLGIVSASYFPATAATQSERHPWGLLYVIAVLGACSWASWRIWLRPIRLMGWEKFRRTV